MSCFDDSDSGEIQDMDYMLLACDISFERGETKPWESKLGGCPYLHTAEEYPIGKNGKPMLFLAQINLKDLHNLPELPQEGLLQFYVEQSQLYGMFADPVVRYIAQADEALDGLLSEHPFADEAYLTALPFTYPGKMYFDEPELEDEAAENSRVGGYPCYQQDGEMEPEEILLLQLADEGECDIGFGDRGVCHFIMDRKALAARDFSQVSYDWDCC